MHDEKPHIIPDPAKGYPQPDVPVDDAWNQMQSLLDIGTTAPSPNGNMKSGGNNFWNSVFMVTAAAIVLISGFYFIQKQSAKSPISQTEVVSKTDSLDEHIPNNTNDILEVSDESIKASNHRSKSNRKDNDQLKLKDKAKAFEKLDKRAIPKITEANNANPVSTYKNNVGRQATLNGSQKIESGIADREINRIKNDSVLSNANTDRIALPTVNAVIASDNVILNRDQIGGGINAEVNAKIPEMRANNPTVDSAKYVGQPTKQGNTEASKPDISPKIRKNAFFNNYHFGLQWNWPMPLNGTDYYFLDYRGKSKPYHLLLPGAFAGKRFKRHEVMAVFTPFQQFDAGNTKLNTVVVFDPVLPDSISGKVITTSVNKTFGIGLRLQYN